MPKTLSAIAFAILIIRILTAPTWGEETGANVEPSPLPPIHAAGKNGDLAKLTQLLLSEGAHVNDLAPNGWTALHFASAFGHDSAAALLLDKGANPEAVAPMGITPLHLAAMRGHPSLVNLLIKRGANPSATSDQGQTPLHLSADDKVVTELAPSAITLNVLNSFGLTPLHSARQSSVARKLLDLGADLRIRTPRGLTAMQLASVESLEKTVGISIHSVMLGRLRGLLSQMPLSITNISVDDLRDLRVTAESPPCSIVVSPPQIPTLRPSERLELALTLTRDKDLKEGDYPVYLHFFIADRPVGSIDLRVDTRMQETPEDAGMIRLAKGNLRPAGSNLHFIAYIGGPLLILMSGLLFRRKIKKKS